MSCPVCGKFDNLTLEAWLKNTGETPLPIRLGGNVLMNRLEAERERATMHFRETAHYIIPCHGICGECYTLIEGFFAVDKDCTFKWIELVKATKNLKIKISK